ncbi:hypothetical protein LSAT2_014236 [Lamellibrachia satsuma]|nr:hypothetical protein LSAT2_014236 [Lamellibrachia satsuma]
MNRGGSFRVPCDDTETTSVQCIPELYLSTGVQIGIVLHPFHGDSDGTSARVGAEFMIDLPRDEQPHLEDSSLNKRPEALQKQQQQREQQLPPHLGLSSVSMRLSNVNVCPASTVLSQPLTTSSAQESSTTLPNHRQNSSVPTNKSASYVSRAHLRAHVNLTGYIGKDDGARSVPRVISVIFIVPLYHPSDAI